MAYSFKAMYETQTSNSYRILSETFIQDTVSETFNTLGVNPEVCIDLLAPE